MTDLSHHISAALAAVFQTTDPAEAAHVAAVLTRAAEAAEYHRDAIVAGRTTAPDHERDVLANAADVARMRAAHTARKGPQATVALAWCRACWRVRRLRTGRCTECRAALAGAE